MKKSNEAVGKVKSLARKLIAILIISVNVIMISVSDFKDGGVLWILTGFGIVGVLCVLYFVLTNKQDKQKVIDYILGIERYEDMI